MNPLTEEMAEDLNQLWTHLQKELPQGVDAQALCGVLYSEHEQDKPILETFLSALEKAGLKFCGKMMPADAGYAGEKRKENIPAAALVIVARTENKTVEEYLQSIEPPMRIVDMSKRKETSGTV